MCRNAAGHHISIIIMGATHNTDQEPSNHIEEKAQLLAKLLEKHNPVSIKRLAMDQMLKVDKQSDAHKVFAAAYEIFDLLK